MCQKIVKKKKLLTTVVFDGVSATICKTLLIVSSPVHCCIFSNFPAKNKKMLLLLSFLQLENLIVEWKGYSISLSITIF